MEQSWQSVALPAGWGYKYNAPHPLPPPPMPLTFRRHLFFILFTLFKKSVLQSLREKQANLTQFPWWMQRSGQQKQPNYYKNVLLLSAGHIVSLLSLVPIITPSPQTIILYYYPRSLFLWQELFLQTNVDFTVLPLQLLCWMNSNTSGRTSVLRIREMRYGRFSKGAGLWSSCTKL